MDYALIGFPLSNAYRERFERAIGVTPTYLWLAELRRLSLPRLLAKLALLNAERIFIPIEDEGCRAFVPISYCVAAVATVRQIIVVRPDLVRERVSRHRALASLVGTAYATVACALSLSHCRRELGYLRSESRADVKCNGSGRVLYLRTNLAQGVKAGGSVGHVAGVVNGFVGKGYPVDFASIERPVLADPSVRYLAIQAPSSFGLPYEANLYRFQKLFASQGIAIATGPYAFVYQRMSLGNYVGVDLSRKLKIPLIIEYNGSEVWVSEHWGVPLRYRKLAIETEDVTLKHAHVVVTVSQVLREELCERGVDPKRIICYPNCIDPKLFDSSRFTTQDITDLRDRIGIRRDAIVAGFVGTFGPWHGLEVLASAIRRMAFDEPEELQRSRLHFLIVGDGMSMSKVKEILSDDRCRPFYTLTGLVPQAEAPSYMAASDILLSPHVENTDGSRFFGSPTKLFEYMAMGRAIIASDLEQIGHVLHKSVRANDLPVGPPGDESSMAVLCSPGNSEELIQGIRFLAGSHEWREVLGRRAKEEALQKYTWDCHVQAILDQILNVG